MKKKYLFFLIITLSLFSCLTTNHSVSQEESPDTIASPQTDTANETSTSETTVSEASTNQPTTNETTASGTIPETSAGVTTANETSTSETTVSEASTNQPTTNETTASGTIPETSAGVATANETSTSETTVSEASTNQPTTNETTASGTIPETSASVATANETTTSETTVSEASTNQPTTNETTASGTISETSASVATANEISTSESTVSEPTTTETIASDEPTEPAGKAEIMFMEGNVIVDRGRNTFQWPDVDFGFIINNYDLVKTDSNGYLEMDLITSSAAGMIIKVLPDTELYFDANNYQGKNSTRLEMLSGSVSLLVDKVQGEDSVTVRTASSILGVRGTEFNVSTAIDGAILVSCTEGKVACWDENGAEYYAVPGTIVVDTQETGLREIPVAISDISTFRDNWLNERLGVLTAGGPELMAYYTSRYYNLLEDFKTNYQEILNNVPILDTWARGDSLSSREIIQQKKIMGPLLLKTSGNLFMFERIYYRISDLEEAFVKGQIQGDLPDGKSLFDFFGEFNSTEMELEKQMNLVRKAFALYSTRFEESPLSNFLQSNSSDSFFDSTDNFFDEALF